MKLLAYQNETDSHYPLAVFCQRWMSLVGDHTLQALWQDDWLPLLIHFIHMTQSTARIDHFTAKSLAGSIGRSINAAIIQRPKLNDILPITCDWNAWANGDIQ